MLGEFRSRRLTGRVCSGKEREEGVSPSPLLEGGMARARRRRRRRRRAVECEEGESQT